MKSKQSENNGQQQGAERSNRRIPADQPVPASKRREQHEETAVDDTSTQPTPNKVSPQSPRPGRNDRGRKPIKRRPSPSRDDEDAEQNLATRNQVAAVDDVLKPESAGDGHCDVQVVGLGKSNLFTPDPNKARAQANKKAASKRRKHTIFYDERGEPYSLIHLDERGNPDGFVEDTEGEDDEPAKPDSGSESWDVRRAARIAEIGKEAYDEEVAKKIKEYLGAGDEEDAENEANAEAKAKAEAEVRAEAARSYKAASPWLQKPMTPEESLAQEKRETHATLEEMAKDAGGTPEEQARLFEKLKETHEYHEIVKKLCYRAHGTKSTVLQGEATQAIRKLNAMATRYRYPWIGDLLDYFQDELKPSWKSARRSATHHAQRDAEGYTESVRSVKPARPDPVDGWT